MSDHPETLTEAELARSLCNLDRSWEHHDQTDDHPCSRCRRTAVTVLRILAARTSTATVDAEREALSAAMFGSVEWSDCIDGRWTHNPRDLCDHLAGIALRTAAGGDLRDRVTAELRGLISLGAQAGTINGRAYIWQDDLIRVLAVSPAPVVSRPEAGKSGE